MRTITLSPNPQNLDTLFEQARHEDLIVQFADGSQFMLTALDDFDLEIGRTRRNKKLMAFLDQVAQQQETIPLDEVKRRLGLE